MHRRIPFLLVPLLAILVCGAARAEDDAAWEAYFASAGDGDVPEAQEDPEFDEPTQAAAVVREAVDEVPIREAPPAPAVAEIDDAEEDDAVALETVTAPGGAAEVTLGTTAPAARNPEPLILFDQAEMKERTFPWGRWIGLNFALALLLGGAVYGAKKGKLAHWLKRARLTRPGRVTVPDLSVVATHNLSHGQAIHLVQGPDFRLLVGSWPNGMTRLTDLPGPADEPPLSTAEEPCEEIPEGAGMTADEDEPEEATAAMVSLSEDDGDRASSEVALASAQADVRIDVGTFDSWFDEEGSADEDGARTVDDDEAPTVKEMAFPEVLKRAAAMAGRDRGAGAEVPPRAASADSEALPQDPPRAVGLFRSGGSPATPHPDHETLAEQVLARVRELRGNR